MTLNPSRDNFGDIVRVIASGDDTLLGPLLAYPCGTARAPIAFVYLSYHGIYSLLLGRSCIFDNISGCEDASLVFGRWSR